MDETLQEYCDWQSERIEVDRSAAMLRGVKILGLRSRNGREYLPEALAAAAPLYENVRVNVNHPKGDPSSPRDYQDRIGTLRQVVVRPQEGLFADFYFNPKHALSEQLLWDAAHAPHNVGFSHNVQARVARRDGTVVVEAITRVQSVDLVADPATTRGLFEGPETREANVMLAAATLDELRLHRADLVLAVLEGAAGRWGMPENERPLPDDPSKRSAIDTLLAEYRLPRPDSGDARARAITSQVFLEALAAAPDEATRRTWVAERARLVEALSAATSGLQARDQWQPYTPPLSTQAFVEAIRG